jgi:hypothetical protein
MTDDGGKEGDEGLPDSDPRHLDPAGDMADMIEAGEVDVTLSDEQSPEELREFIDAAEAGEFGDADPGLEATVRIARALLDGHPEDDGDPDTTQ